MYLYVRNLIMNKPFLITSDNPPLSEIKQGSLALSNVWGGGIEEVSCEISPSKILNNLIEGKGLILLKGDSAQNYSGNGSWLEALADWHLPVIILVNSLASGNTPGSAFAYSALCRQLSISLVGFLQVGGVWDVSKKVKDNLPWCGWLPSKPGEIIEIINNANTDYLMDIEDVAFYLRRKLLYISNKS